MKRIFATALCLASVCAYAQPMLAIVQFNAPPDSAGVKSYVDGLREQGLVEGSTLRIERRYAHGDQKRVEDAMAEVARLRPAVTFTVGHDIAKYARERHPELVVVTAGSEDPVLSGLVKSIARPGDNVTGVTFMSPQLAGKRLELLKAAVPGLKRVAVAWDPTHFDNYYRDMGPAAVALGITLVPFEVRTQAEVEKMPAAAMAAGTQALFVVPSRLTQINAARIARLCSQARLPAMSAYASFAEAGGLLAYGADIEELMRSAAVQTRKILSGTRAGDIPVVQAQRFLLVVNRRAAQDMALRIPADLLIRADRVIE